MKELQHLAFIMDGNGRWAKAQDKNRFWGHVKGAEVAQEIVEHCAKNTNIKYLTLYAFSTENWSRPKEEISFLFKLLEKHLQKKQAYLLENNVLLRVIGDLSALPQTLQIHINSLVEKTSSNTGLNLTLALNYGGRDELVTAMKKFLKTKPASEDITSENFEKHLYTFDIPDPDLIIRTSGEMRLSNFMLWQAAYSEFYFTKVLWPDFSVQDLNSALIDYKSRHRRFGAIPEKKSQLEPPTF